MAAIVGMGVAVDLAVAARAEHWSRLSGLREAFLAEVQRDERLRVLAPGAKAGGVSPAIVALLVPGAPAEVWLHHLADRGVLVGTGSACQSRKPDISPTYAALGLLPSEARCVLRISFGPQSELAEARCAGRALLELTPELGVLKP